MQRRWLNQLNMFEETLQIPRSYASDLQLKISYNENVLL